MSKCHCVRKIKNNNPSGLKIKYRTIFGIISGIQETEKSRFGTKR